MDIQEATRSYLFSVLQIEPFEQVIQVIDYLFTKPSAHWMLPLYSCQSVGGNQSQSIPAVSAMIAFQTAILLVDDLLDNDGRREILGLSVGETANLATVFQAVGLECITQNLPGPEEHRQIVNQINQMMVETAYGQALDHQNPDSEEAYWRAARAKSCPFFGLAFYLGAVMGGASIETATAIQKLGRLYGEMIQIHDDLSDCLSTSIGSDWIQKKAALPILFARIVDHPDRQKFMSLLELGTDSDSIRTAQEILLRCGAVSFCIDQIIQRHKIGMQILGELKLSDSQSFNQLFNGIVEPIWKLPGIWS